MPLRPGSFSYMSCGERDRIILAFALAANEHNLASGEFENAATDAERLRAQQSVDAAKGYCFHLRDLVMRHCTQHGC
jgi:hypothetical protein